MQNPGFGIYDRLLNSWRTISPSRTMILEDYWAQARRSCWCLLLGGRARGERGDDACVHYADGPTSTIRTKGQAWVKHVHSHLHNYAVSTLLYRRRHCVGRRLGSGQEKWCGKVSMRIGVTIYSILTLSFKTRQNQDARTGASEGRKIWELLVDVLLSACRRRTRSLSMELIATILRGIVFPLLYAPCFVSCVRVRQSSCPVSE